MIKALFKRERETKNKIRFEEVSVPGQPLVVGTLYVDKSLVADAETIEVTINVTSKLGASAA